MSLEELKKFSNELKEHREKTGITLQQISQKTKIDIKFLKSIEESNFDILPEIYIKAFIKEYAACIDYNPTLVLEKYNNAKYGKVEEKTTTEKVVNSKIENEFVDENHQDITSKPKSIQNNSSKIVIKLNYVLGTIILLAAISILYFSIIYNPQTEIITVNGQSQNKETERFIVEKKDSLQDSFDKNIVPDDSLKLTIISDAELWVKVIKDGINVHQKRIPPDSKLNFKAKEKFSVSVGNAGVVKILLNNNEIKNIGKIGEIKNIRITKDTVIIYDVKKNEQKSN
ncbi:MAG: DUF4115 domain-containing protein [Melioribacteraceae bacterium]|nr:DUF4115 domain-containing protein [Melioribacteraceae bacterium]